MMMCLLRRPLLLALAACLSIAGPGGAQEGGEGVHGPTPQKQEAVAALTAANRERYAGQDHVLVLPGLVADRQARRVVITTEATGLANGEPVEYLLVHTRSSHGYEALLWSHAKPSDVHRALAFIGLPPGEPVDPTALRFWGKGEPVAAALEDEGGDQVPLGELVMNRQTQEGLPAGAFLFTGSLRVADRETAGETLYMADVYDPHAVISGFNDPASVLDVAWQSTKETVYQTQIANPDAVLEAHTLYQLVLSPALPPGQRRVRDLRLRVATPTTYHLTETDGDTDLTDETDIDAVLQYCLTVIQAGQKPYVQLRFSDTMQLQEIRGVAAAFSAIDQPQGLRIEPPAPGRLYYQAFLPSKRLLDPLKRPGELWELHLQRQDGALSGSMVFHEQVWTSASVDPTIATRRYDAPTAESVRQRLDEDAEFRQAKQLRTLPDALLVVAPADLPYGELLAFLGPALRTHGTVHLFLQP